MLIDALRKRSDEIIGMVDSDSKKQGMEIMGVKVIGGDDRISDYGTDEIMLVNAVGSVGPCAQRRAIFEKFSSLGYAFAALVHPSAVTADEVVIEQGAQVMAGAVIQPGVRLGANCIVNTNSSVDHDCIVGEHVHIAPGATVCGNVSIGAGAFVGAGSVIIQGIKIGAEVVIGAGAVVVNDAPGGAVIKGNPAREAKN